jgi:hypothetical protein
MSDTGEQGMNPKDPAQRAGIGGGIVPDDNTEGQDEQEAAQSKRSKNEVSNERPDTADRSSMPAANQTKTEPIPASEHESAPPSGTSGG